MTHCENKRLSDSQDLLLETLKNRFLAAIYRRDPEQTRQVYLLISTHARQCLPHPGETREKILRQVQAAFLQFYEFVTSPSVNLFIPFQELKTWLAGRVKTRQNHVCHIDFDLWQARTGLAPWQLDRVIENAITVQLTSGCSHFCRRCNEWALPGVRAHFSYAAAGTLLKRLIQAGNTDPALYGASDPLDWEDGPHSFDDLLIPLAHQAQFSLITKLPRGKKRVLRRLTKHNIPISVSVTDRNRARIAAFETDAGICLQKQHDSNDLLIPAGLDEDFSHIKSSITDAYGTEITPEGMFIIIPTFTSALYPMGHKKVPVTGKTAVFPVKTIGRQALLKDYFKPLEMVGQENKPFYLSKLLDIQVETLLLDNGSMELSPPGMRNLREYFTIFQEPARLQRKHMTRSIVKGLKKQWFPHGRYHDLPRDQQRQYRRKIAAHLNFCNKEIVTQSRICAVSFFLQAVLDYLKEHKDENTIIAHLIQPEADQLAHRYDQAAWKTDLHQLFSHDTVDIFDRFRFYVTAMVCDRLPLRTVTRFIQTYPAAYDPVEDRFVPSNPMTLEYKERMS